jgi:uroporphyrinogen-III decarboxylase
MGTFKCPEQDQTALSPEFLQRHGLLCPDVYTDADSMIKAALAIKEETDGACVFLPFCHTTEAEGYGANITLTDGCGARAAESALNSIDELLNLPAWDLASGRFAAALRACRELAAEHTVMFNITGPLGILNCLLPAAEVFKLLRKGGPVLAAFYERCQADLLLLIEAALQAGAAGIAYADPMAGSDLAGPKYAAALARDFAAPFLAAAAQVLGDKASLVVCPKTGMVLRELGLAEELPQVCGMHSTPFALPASEGLYLRHCVKCTPPSGCVSLFEIKPETAKQS